MIRVWLQNCYANESDKHKLIFRKGYMSRLWNDTLLEIGKPKATAAYTSKELQKRGLVGLYGYRFVRPIEDYKKYGALNALRNSH